MSGLARVDRVISLWLLLSMFTLVPEGRALGRKPPQTEVEKGARAVALESLLSMHDCYELALKQSEAIAIKKEDIEKTEADFLNATSEVLGDISYIRTTTRQDAARTSGGDSSSVGSTFSARERNEGKFTFTQPLFQGFKSLGALTGAGGLRGQRREEWKRAKELLFLDVVQAFYQVLKYEKDVDIIKKIKHSLEERAEELSEREKIGRSRPSEVATAKARLKNIEADLIQSENALRIGQHILEFLTGTFLEPQQLTDVEFSPFIQTEPNTSAFSQSSENRSDVKAAKQALKVSCRAIIVEQSALWPVISLEANRYTERDGFQSNIDWDTLLKLEIPIFNGGGTVGKIKGAITNWKKAKLSYSLAKRRALLEIKEAYENLIAAQEKFSALKASVEASRQNYELQKEEYARNLVGNLDVLEALEEFHQASRQANQSYYDMKANYWHFQIASGQLP